MSLNIKNEKTHRLIRELSDATGENQTTAVTIAVQERLDRVRKERKASLADRILAIGRDAGSRWREPFNSRDHGDILYDENGLPK